MANFSFRTPISIVSIASISPLGVTAEQVWDNYENSDSYITWDAQLQAAVAKLSAEGETIVAQLRAENSKYKNLDNSVLYGVYSARKAILAAGWESHKSVGINIGSSRGATALFEKYHAQYMQSQLAATLCSPTTTLGNLSSWIAQDLQTQGPVISHSITCSTALHALLNGIAWLQSGMADFFMIGGTEAPLTPFTIAQMQALKIYTTQSGDYPCRALDFSKKSNSMALGEGAAIACLEVGESKQALAVIEGIGYATESITHGISISAEAKCIQQSMQMAIGGINPDAVDCIVMHAPGTIKGDLAEYRAIQAIFPNTLPILTTNKWKIGHSFGASGMLSIELAIAMLRHQKMITVPYISSSKQSDVPKKVLVNAVGFGGNAVSILLSCP